MLAQPSVDVAEHLSSDEEHDLAAHAAAASPRSDWYVRVVERRRIPASEWRRMSDAEQRAAIRPNRTDLEDLPEDFRCEVEEVLANARPLSS